jgi:hypothetical protein
MNNLSKINIADSARATRVFFERYGKLGKEFRPDDVSSVIGFFQSRGFDDDAAIAVSLNILKTAKRDRRPVFEILDTLKTFDGLQLSVIVSKILNQNRLSISSLGFRSQGGIAESVSRNIRP